MKKTFLLILILIFQHQYVYCDSLKFYKKIIPSTPVEIWQFCVNNNKIYLKSSDNKIYIINDDGKVINSIGKSGNAPGEFKLLEDFMIDNNKIYIADFYNKINIYNENGKLLKIIKTKYRIEKLFKFNNNLFYLANNFVDKKFRKLNILNVNENKELFSIKDESLIDAVNPQKGEKMGFPWFPAPYYNRPVFIVNNWGGIELFFLKRKFFYQINENNNKKININYNFNEEKLTNDDKEIYFSKIEENSSMKLNSKLKESISFPFNKQLFLSCIKWNDNFALLQEKAFIIINSKGKYVKKIIIPENLSNLIKSTESPLDTNICLYKNKLYFNKLNESIVVYSIFK